MKTALGAVGTRLNEYLGKKDAELSQIADMSMPGLNLTGPSCPLATFLAGEPEDPERIEFSSLETTGDIGPNEFAKLAIGWRATVAREKAAAELPGYKPGPAAIVLDNENRLNASADESAECLKILFLALRNECLTTDSFDFAAATQKFLTHLKAAKFSDGEPHQNLIEFLEKGEQIDMSTFILTMKMAIARESISGRWSLTSPSTGSETWPEAISAALKLTNYLVGQVTAEGITDELKIERYKKALPIAQKLFDGSHALVKKLEGFCR